MNMIEVLSLFDLHKLYYELLEVQLGILGPKPWEISLYFCAEKILL